jgi:N-acetylmuramoyl-L-alanine amidase
MTAIPRYGQLLLLVVALAMSFALAPIRALADAQAPTIRVDGQVVPFEVSPFVGDDGAVYAPVDLVYRLGGAYSTNNDGTVTVTSASGATSALPAKLVSSRYCVSVPALVDALGVHGVWNAAGNTYAIDSVPDIVPQPTTPAAGPQPLAVTGIIVTALSDTLTRISVTVTGPAKFDTVTLSDPDRLAFDLVGVQIGANFSGTALAGNNPLIRTIRAGLAPQGSPQGAPPGPPPSGAAQAAPAAQSIGRVVFDLVQPVQATVTQEPADDDGSVTYLIDVQPAPPPAPSVNAALPLLSNALKGRVVMVDPGHGGSDTGAVGIGGVDEKTYTLIIGKLVRDTLQQNGATVYMTRDDDSFPELHERPKMAIAVGADYFISVHCDDSGSRDSHTGTTVYYHAHDPVCRRLAACIINRVAAVSGIPSDGVRSDTVRFQTGFAVLRGSPMPAVLVECGYMNNHNDLAKLQTPSAEQAIAQGIVAGLIDFDTEQRQQ